MWPFTTYPERSPAEVDGKTFDYIIVGGGTGGCALASRLSEDPDVSVLVLEKGHVKDNLLSRMPLASSDFRMGDTLQVNTRRFSEPIPGSKDGRRTRLWTAEGVGGATRINAMLLTRCTPGDYAKWSEMGLQDWGWESVEPYFRKIENAIDHPQSAWRGHEGPIQVRRMQYPFKWIPYVEKMVGNLGLPVVMDMNDPKAPAMGYFNLDVAIDKSGNRVSMYKAYLGKKVALERQNRLTVCTGVVASSLDIDSEAGLVRGVHIRPVKSVPSDAQFFVKARREVIVCSGAIGSAKLLILSGIGPKEQLDALNIPTTKVLEAVGTELRDHYSVPIMVEVPRNDSLHLLESMWAMWYILIWMLFGAGLMGCNAMTAAMFIRTSAVDEKTLSIKPRDENEAGPLADNMDATQSRNVPDAEIMIIPANSTERVIAGKSLISFYPTVVQPYSSGSIRVISRDPMIEPRITHPMFRDERDLLKMRVAVRFAMRLAEELQRSGYPYPNQLFFAPGNNLRAIQAWEDTPDLTIPAMPKSAAPVVNEVEVLPKSKLDDDALTTPTAPKTWRDVTDDEIDDYSRRIGRGSLHVACTCRMSNDEDSGVVDQRLRVHGVKNLRIADASIFPDIPSGHTMAPTVMVAERCAYFIKQEWKGRKSV